jgi:hypothetical protein
VPVASKAVLKQALKREGRSEQRRGRAKQKKGDLKDLLS